MIPVHMTPEQERHLEEIKREFLKLVDKKYRQGQIQHGGDLWQKPGTLSHAIEEAIDLVVYLLTMKNYPGSL